MHIVRCGLLLILCSALGARPTWAGHGPPGLESARAQAWNRYVHRDYPGFVGVMEGVRECGATTEDLYNLACGYALTGHVDEALATLAEVVARGGDYNLLADPDLASLREEPAFLGLVERTTYARAVSAKLESARAKAMEAYGKGRYEAFVAIMNTVASFSNDEVDWYNLACGYSRIGRTEDALILLERLARTNALAADPWSDDDFAALREEPRFLDVTRRSSHTHCNCG